MIAMKFDDQSRRNPFAERAGEFTTGVVTQDPDAASSVFLTDLTAQPRAGFKGKGTLAWMHEGGYAVPDRINQVVRQPDGELLARLGQEELLVLSGCPNGNAASRDLVAEWRECGLARKGYNAYRDETWAWMHIGGKQADHLLAKICPVDLRQSKFQLHDMAQTRVAFLECIIIRSDRFGVLGFDVLFDIASTGFFAQVVETAAQEFLG